MADIKVNNGNKFCWMRQLEVRLYSKLYNVKPMIFGSSAVKNFKYHTGEGYNEPTIINNVEYKDVSQNGLNYSLETEYMADQLNINVKGVKKLTALEDNGVCEISNLTYATIAQIILGQYYKIEIWAGYRTQQLQCYFSGEIAYISNEIQMRRDHKCHIIFASALVAGYSQARINFNLNSGINLYAALKYICLTSGIDSSHLNENLKNEVITEVSSNWGTPATLVETLTNQTSTFSANGDSSIDGSIVNCSSIADKRQIRINSETISFKKGNPRLTKDGIEIYLMPTFCFVTGDIIIIDNSLLNVSETSLQGAQTNFSSNYFDTTFVDTDTPNLGAYMIRQIDYTFENRGENFELKITARAVSIIKATLGLNY